MYFHFAPFIFAVSLLLKTIPKVTAADDGPCCICGYCWAAPNKGHIFVNANQVTCNDKILEVAGSIDKGTKECKKQSDLFYDRCCTTKPATPILQAPPISPCINIPDAGNPSCDLCHDGAYPTKPTTVTAILGISGNPSCGGLYCLALKGHVPDQICKPMQDYMDEPCGCYSRFPGSAPGKGNNDDEGDPMKDIPDKKVIVDRDDDKDDQRLSLQERQRGGARKLKGLKT